MSTDVEWEKWALQDPYFSVLTDPKFRNGELTAEAKEEFFHSGRVHAEHMLHSCRAHIDATFAPQRVLDFGCGVGRVLIAFAALTREAVGMDVAPTMLAEARKNCELRAAANVSLVVSDDTLSAAEGQFDLVHSCIVLQHIEVSRGRAIFARLVDKVAPGGCGAIHVTYGWDVHAATFGVPPPLPTPAPVNSLLAQAKATVRCLAEPFLSSKKEATVAAAVSGRADPEMQMNYYNLSELMFILHRAGVHRIHSEFTDHGGALGMFLYFQKPATR